VEALLERAQVQRQLSRQSEEGEVIASWSERLDLSAGRAEVRAGCGRGTVPAVCLRRNGCRWCAHKFMADVKPSGAKESVRRLGAGCAILAVLARVEILGTIRLQIPGCT
jgi:hypothetical protein